MTEKLKEEVKVQKWVLLVFLALLPILMGFTLNTIVTLTTTQNRVDYNKERIETNEFKIDIINDVKANKTEVNKNYDLLLKINDKLDNYILNNRNNG